jgi:hypothetical protein
MLMYGIMWIQHIMKNFGEFIIQNVLTVNTQLLFLPVFSLGCSVWLPMGEWLIIEANKKFQ